MVSTALPRDLLIGALDVRQVKESAIPHLLVVPALLLTFLVGAVGLVLFLRHQISTERSLARVIP